jgi:PAS domain S-box-containing protein
VVFFVPPVLSFELASPVEAITLAVYFVTSAAIAVLVGGWRSAIQRERALGLALAASEEQFRLLADSSPALIWVTNENAQVTFANRRYEEVFGQPSHRIEGEGWRNIVHPDDAEAFNALFLDALTKRERFAGEVRVQDAAGEVMWLHCEGVPHFGADGTFLGYVGANLNISPAKRAEEQLRHLNDTLERRVSEAVAEKKLLADLIEDTDAFVQVADLDFRWLAINKSAADEFERVFGVRPEVGVSMLELLAPWPEHQAAVREVWSRALSGEEFIEVGEFGDPGRDRRSYEMRYHVLRDAAGGKVGAYQFVYDVTERVDEQRRLSEAEAARRDADALYRTYFQHSPEALFVIAVEPDGAFVVEQINPAHEQGVGFRPRI